jgi:hypothetical protein
VLNFPPRNLSFVPAAAGSGIAAPFPSPIFADILHLASPTFHLSPFTFHLSRLTFHVSSPSTNHESPVINHFDRRPGSLRKPHLSCLR